MNYTNDRTYLIRYQRDARGRITRDGNRYEWRDATGSRLYA
jgi:hypothetical protein